MSKRKKGHHAPKITYFQEKVARLVEKFGHEPTDEELCAMVRYEQQYHATAWRLLIRRKASPDHFKKIARSSSIYQPKACLAILEQYRDVDDLLFVAIRPVSVAAKAVKLLAAMQLTQNVMEKILETLQDEQRVVFMSEIVLRNQHNVSILEVCIPDIYTRYAQQLHTLQVPYHLMGSESVKMALRGKQRVAAARQLLRDQPTLKSYRMIFDAIQTEYTAPFLENVFHHCLAKNGINWQKACEYIPELLEPARHNALKECIEMLLSISNRPQGLRILLQCSAPFRKYAAGCILGAGFPELDDIRLVLTFGTKHQRNKAAFMLASRKGIHFKLLLFAWRRSSIARPQLEEKIIGFCNPKTRALLASSMPTLHARLQRQYPSRFKT